MTPVVRAIVGVLLMVVAMTVIAVVAVSYAPNAHAAVVACAHCWGWDGVKR